MEREIDYYFTAASPWTYLGHDLFMAMTTYAGVQINFKPVDYAAVFEISGGLPVGKRPIQRQHYRLFELQRWRTHRNKPLNLQPKFFPVDANFANRVILAAQAAGAETGKFAGAVMRAVWTEDRNIADAETLQAIAGEQGLDGAALVAAANGDTITDEYRVLTDEAKRREVFGAPTYLYRDEPFWGQDRLEFVERALNGETPPHRLP